MNLILRITAGGFPQNWVHWQEAVLDYAKGHVVWTHGEDTMRVYGGINRMTSKRSYMDIHPIIAVKGHVSPKVYDHTPPLTNRELFSRDSHTCMYCLTEFRDKQLTRDHVVPISRGGKDVWTNVVTACRSCNNRKAARLLSEISMRLKAVPYAPNHAEWLILRNRNILSDQMEFLKAQCPKARRQMI